MSNLAAVLRTEVTRLARKVTKESNQSIQRSSAAHRKQIAALRRQVAALEKEVKRLRTDRGRPDTKAPAEAEGRPLRFVAKGLRSLRSRLDLSAAELGKLVGVSGQTIYHWEQGKSVPRAKQLAGLARVRGMGKREAAAELTS